MRTLIIAGVALASLGAAWADDSTAEKAKKTDNCSYMLMDGQLVDLPVGANVCVRSKRIRAASLLSAPSRN